MTPDAKIILRLKKFQLNEITEHFIYLNLSKHEKVPANKLVLEKIAADELKHYHLWKNYTQVDLRPDRSRIFFYTWMARILGLTFTIKRMEKGENHAQVNYEDFIHKIPEAKSVMDEENVHEAQLIAMIEEERLNYIGSIVLGLNDALIELTGVLAGLSFALQNTRLIAVAGLITGIATAFPWLRPNIFLKRKKTSQIPLNHPFTLEYPTL